MPTRYFALLWLILWQFPAIGQPKELPYKKEVIVLQSNKAFLILPNTTGNQDKLPWVWYAPALPGLPGPEENWMFEKFLEAGIAIAGIDVGESMGNSRGRKIYSLFYQELVGQRGYSSLPVLLARSRGGLMLYSWAADHPKQVGAIAGIYPVVDLRSYPGIEKAAAAYGYSAKKMTRKLKRVNPIAKIRPLAKSGIPILHLHGDQDELVPLAKNSGAVDSIYHRYDKTIRLLVQPGQGHNMWPGFFQSQELVDFVIRNANP